jgi:hypothetical protein
MSIEYDNKPADHAELLMRAHDLLSGGHHTRHEVANNCAMLANMLGHTMLYVATLEERIAVLEVLLPKRLT